MNHHHAFRPDNGDIHSKNSLFFISDWHRRMFRLFVVFFERALGNGKWMLIIFFALVTSLTPGSVEVFSLMEMESSAKTRGPLWFVSTERGAYLGKVSEFWPNDSYADKAGSPKKRDILIAGDTGPPYEVVAEFLDAWRSEGIPSARLVLRRSSKP